MTGARWLALLLAAPVLSAGASPPPSHDAEIVAFARIMAETVVAFERCPGVEIDEVVEEAAKDRLHIVDADYFAFRAEAHRIAEGLRTRMTVASDPAWCAEVYGRYGPDGSELKGALKR